MKMKRIIPVVIAALLLISVMFCGCAPAFDKSPDEYKDIKWVTNDYSFRINPSDDCKGNYNFQDTKYNIQAEFDGSHISVKDTDKNKELFYGEWIYDGDHLYIHGISYNTSDYKEFEDNYSEFYSLHQEKISK